MNKLRARLAWAKLKNRIKFGPPVALPPELFTDMLKGHTHILGAEGLPEGPCERFDREMAAIQEEFFGGPPKDYVTLDGKPLAMADEEPEPTVVFDPALTEKAWFDQHTQPTIVFNPAQRQREFEAGERRFMKMNMAHAHVMHMILDPADFIFVRDIMHNSETKCRFQYRGVNLYTHFTWDGSTTHYTLVRAQHVKDTIDFLAGHGITATLGL